jgi:hypothetical protein
MLWLALLATAVVDVRIETQDDKPLTVALRTATDEVQCENPVAPGQPCALSIAPGPVQLRLEESSLDLHIDAPEALRVHHRDYTGTAVGAVGTGLGIAAIAGGVVVLGRSPGSLQSGLDNILLSFALVTIGAVVAVPSLVLLAGDLSKPRATVEHLPR